MARRRRSCSRSWRANTCRRRSSSGPRWIRPSRSNLGSKQSARPGRRHAARDRSRRCLTGFVDRQGLKGVFGRAETEPKLLGLSGMELADPGTMVARPARNGQSRSGRLTQSIAETCVQGSCLCAVADLIPLLSRRKRKATPRRPRPRKFPGKRRNLPEFLSSRQMRRGWADSMPLSWQTCGRPR